ncbi:hypothetical protein HDV00_008864 [Rhizophlyctis rosea]|nr:hypothetical protein HDV00_008864 [Rhizophlyctis rosea]
MQVSLMPQIIPDGMVNYLANELPANDTITWGSFSGQRLLALRIHQLTKLHLSLRSDVLEVPSTDAIPELAPICRNAGLCLADIGCDDRPFNETIGFDRELLLSGVDNLLEVFIQHATEYLLSNNFTYYNADLYFLTNLEPDLTDGIRKIDNTLLYIERGRSQNFLQITKVLFSVGIVAFILFYIMIFSVIISAAKTQMAMMVTVLFWIPNEIAEKSADIQKFLVSGVVEVTEENQ